MTRYGGLLLLAGLCGFASLRAQDPRDSLVSKAIGEFDAAHRVQLLVAALDPRLGPPSGAWGTGVQLLAQTLIEEGQDPVAAAWFRWAIRLSPDFQADTVQLLPRAVAAYRAAREFVRQTATVEDTVVATSWVWLGPESDHDLGRIQVAPTAVPESALVSVEGIGAVRSAGVPVAPGSYAIRAAALGYDSARVTREVLPGVTTMLELRLRVRPAPVSLPPSPVPAPVVTPRRGKRFPWVLAALGAAGAGTLVAVLAGGSGQPTTGGIVITFPNP